MKLLLLTAFIPLIFSTISFSNVKEKDNGPMFYAASYSSDPINEPRYSIQKSKTFDYMEIDNSWDTYRGDNVKVAVIDSGINYDHEDFMVNSATIVNANSKQYVYESGKGWVYYVAGTNGYSYIEDNHGHGTNVAATVGAAINGVGGLGVAPNIDLYVYKVTNANNGYEWTAIINALNDCVTRGIDVINMSFQAYENGASYGGETMEPSSGCSTVLSTYINNCYNAGITLVGAAGNYNTDQPSYPGSNNHVINVGSFSSTSKTSKAPYSNYGSTIDLVAPGYVDVANKGENDAYKTTSGTSFSAPIVTGAIALYKQKHPSATPEQIETALYQSCDPIDSGSEYSNWAGHGALNIKRFLADKNVISVTSEPSTVTVTEGKTFNLSLSATLDDETVVELSPYDYAVDSNDETICTVDSNGVVSGLKAGTTTLSGIAGDNMFEFSIPVTVNPAPVVEGVSVSPKTLSLRVGGQSQTLTATVSGSYSPSTEVTWQSSNTSVATVSNSGVVTPKSVGNAIITATSVQDTTKTGTCNVTVEEQITSYTATYTALTKKSASLSSGTAPEDSSIVLDNNDTNQAYQIANNKRAIWTLSGYEGCLITKIEVDLKRNSGGGNGSITLTNNNEAVDLAIPTLTPSILTTSFTYKAIYSDETGFICEGDIILTINSTASSLFNDAIRVTYSNPDYSDKIVNDLDASYTGPTLYVGDSISKDNVSVIASYTIAEKYPSSALKEKEFEISGFSSTTSGIKEVTVTYCGALETTTTPLETTFNVMVNDDAVIDVTPSVSKSYHPGDTIIKNDITVTLSFVSGRTSVTTDFQFNDDGYQFTYDDAPSGGSTLTKQFSIYYATTSYSFNVNVSREAYASQSTTTTTLSADSVFDNIGGSATSLVNGTIIYNNITYEYYQSYYYSKGKTISFGNESNQTGYITNQTPFATCIKEVNVTKGSTSKNINIRYSEDGVNWVLKSDADSSKAYKYFKLDCVGVSGATYSNIKSISIKLDGAETANNVANYIMYEDTKNQCINKLPIALKYFANMSASERATFMTSNDYVLSTARERLQNWANSQGKSIIYTNGDYIVSSANNLFINKGNNDAAIIIVIVSSLLCLSIVSIGLVHKSKENY